MSKTIVYDENNPITGIPVLDGGAVAVQAESGTHFKTVNSESILGSGNLEIEGGSSGIFTPVTGSYASATTFTLTGTDIDIGLNELSLVTCTNAAGTKRRVGFITSVVNSNPGGSGTITCTVAMDTDLLAGDKDFMVAYTMKVSYLEKLTSIPGEAIADTAYSQGLWFQRQRVDFYMPVTDILVLTAATGSGALTYNIYKDSTAMYAAAPDLTTNRYLLNQRPSKALGSTDTQYDITNPAGTTFRYTYDGTGTDPGITASNPAEGDTVIIAAQNFNAGNNGTFVVTASGTNYFEVTNAGGVAEDNKTVGTGYIRYNGLGACLVSAAQDVSGRIMSSAGTVKAADVQIRIPMLQKSIFTSF